MTCTGPTPTEEVKELVSPEVAARLDPHKRYGVWWFNRRTATTRQVSEATENGRRYRKEYRWRIKPKEERAAGA